MVKWYSGPSSFVASGTTYTTPTLSATATYYATSYNSSTQCESAMSSVVLTISSYPAAPSVTTPSPVCISGAFSLTATPGAGGNNINWYSVPSGGSALFSGTSVTTPSIASTTVYYAETIGTLGCLSQARTPVTATVNPEPIATGLSATSVCPYGASVVTGSPGPNGTTLKIYDGMLVNSNWLNHSGGTSYTTPSLTSSTTYYVASFNSTTGCESSFDDRMPVTAVVNPTPAAPPLSDITVSTNTCDPKTLSCSGAPNGVSWYWQGNSANGTDTSPLAAASTYIAATNGSNQYYIGARSSSGCWNASNTAVTVNVQIRPTADASVNPTIFSGQATSVQFTNTNNVPGTIYSWTVSSSSNVSGAAAGVGSSITQNISINNGTSGAVTYNVIPSANGCAGPAFTPVVTVYPVPVITPPQAYIVGGSATLDIGPGYSSYRWFKDTGSLSDQRTMTTSQTGTYSCTVTMLGGATYTQSFTVNSQFSGVQMNYVVTNSALVSGISDPAALENLPVEQVNQSVGYFDGLGRLVQTVITQGSPLKNDLVTPTTYDAFGRESRKYLLVSLESNGRYKNILMGSDGTYTNVLNYNNNEPDKVIDDTRPFSETIFEPSPLNRPLQQFGPGQDWKTNNKYVGYQYLVNQTNEVYLFIYEAATGLVTLPSGPSGYYNAGQLYAHVTTDERGNDVIEYIDKLNRTVCKKVQYGSDANGKLYASTYYLYDDLGNLVVVLPPEAVKKLEK
ncbi:MAG: hypothetical protein JST48_09455 [Bacteroidetes bacterium]|nr:hypothetical protein [Bacteroidota bacterium]